MGEVYKNAKTDNCIKYYDLIKKENEATTTLKMFLCSVIVIF